jgi:uncharacterized protein (DUF1501 family)
VLPSDISSHDALRHLSRPNSDMNLSRRRFLQAIAGGAGVAAASSFLPSGMASALTPVGPHDGILLMIYLAGGNDGLNTVVPFGQNEYRANRPDIAISSPDDAGAANPALRLDGVSGIGLHPNLGFLQQQFNQKQLAIVQGVGVPDPNYSHFEMLARWMEGSNNGSSLSPTGWIGRWLDGASSTDLLSAVNIGWGGIPLHLIGVNRSAVALSPYDGGYGGDTDEWRQEGYKAIRSMATRSTTGTWASEVANALSDQLSVASQVAPAYVGVTDNSDLRQFAVAAGLINANVGVRVINIEIGNFDNHSSEPVDHADNMKTLNDGLQLFWSMLSPSFQNRTTAMTFSEFGRRLLGNSSKGSDHGSASCLFLMGPRVNGGMHGQYPSLKGGDLLENNQLRATVDFRQVYQQLADKWLGADSRQLLGATYGGLNLFSASPGDIGGSPDPVPTPVIVATGSSFRAIVPERILDTRSGIGAPARPVGPNGVLDLAVAGVGHVPPTDVTAVLMNVTATGPTESGFLTVWPKDAPFPNASNLNFETGQTVPNLVLAKLGAGGKVSMKNSAGDTHLIADVCGYFVNKPGSRLVPLTPFRALDTRSMAPGVLHLRGVATIKLAAVGGIPSSGIDAVALNVTAVAPTAAGFLTVWPAGEAMPVTSNLNFGPDQTVPNMVVSKVSADGSISVYNDSGDTHLIIDIVGYYASTSGTGIISITPSRLLDTRGTSSVGENGVHELPVAGVGPVPATGVRSVMLNVTVVAPTSPGFVTVFPAGADRPNSSSLNFAKGQTVANLVLAKVGTTGRVAFFNRSGNTHLVVDVVGYSVD